MHPLDGLDESLSERERMVLQALVDAHINTAEPVGSKALADIADLGVSPATIRSVLAALSDRGLIEQPHTSAGRIPTDRGLRYYVDSLLQLQVPTAEQQREIATRLESASAVEDTLREASRVLSRLSKHTSLVLALRPQSERLKHVELVRLRDDAVLLILVSAEGAVQNRLLDWHADLGEGPQALLKLPAPSANELDHLSKRLTALLEGHTLDEGPAVVRGAIAAAQHELQDLERRMLLLSAAGLQHKSAADDGVHVEGAARLLEANATDDLARTKELLALLDEHDRVRALLERAVIAPGLRVFIGAENPAAALSKQGLVTAGLGKSGQLGVLGVIGPRHLDYARVVPLVDLTAQLLSQLTR